VGARSRAAAAQRAGCWPGGGGLAAHLAQAGDRVVQPELAALLSAIGASGRSAFYEGSIAESVAAAARRHGGTLDAPTSPTTRA
jgi:gamma-glutamyltranspeptidase/glutathione hydrolase